MQTPASGTDKSLIFLFCPPTPSFLFLIKFMPVLLLLRAGAPPLEVMHLNDKQRNISDTVCKACWRPGILNTQWYSLATIKYLGKLLCMKHDAPEVNAKLSGRLGLAVGTEVLNGDAFLSALPHAHTKHGWQSPEAALLCRAPTAEIRLWRSGMPCRGGGWILWASKAWHCQA